MHTHRIIVLVLAGFLALAVPAAAQVPGGTPSAAVDGPAVYSENYGKGPWTIVHGGGVDFIWGTGNVGFDNPIIAIEGIDGESFEEPALGIRHALAAHVWIEGAGLSGIWGTGNVGFDNPIIALSADGAALWWSGAHVGFEDPALGFEDPLVGFTGAEHAFGTPVGAITASTPDATLGGPGDVQAGTDGASVGMNVPERRIPTPDKLPLLP